MKAILFKKFSFIKNLKYLENFYGNYTSKLFKVGVLEYWKNVAFVILYKGKVNAEIIEKFGLLSVLVEL